MLEPIYIGSLNSFHITDFMLKFNASVEIREPKELAVEGYIPAALTGTLYRTGPGHYQIPNTQIGTFKATHWFGML
jgi:carotenoid cleavage dioxygenase-like enzyme